VKKINDARRAHETNEAEKGPRVLDDMEHGRLNGFASFGVFQAKQQR